MALVIRLLLLAACLALGENQVLNKYKWKRETLRQKDSTESLKSEHNVSYHMLNKHSSTDSYIYDEYHNDGENYSGDDDYGDENDNGDENYNVDQNSSGDDDYGDENDNDDANYNVDENSSGDDDYTDHADNDNGNDYENYVTEVPLRGHNSTQMEIPEGPPNPNAFLKIPLGINKAQILETSTDRTEETTPTTEITNTKAAIPQTTLSSEATTESTNENTDVDHFNTKSLPKCPEGLNYYENQYGISICYLITEPTTFPPPCPYPNTIEYYFLKNQYRMEITKEQVWVFATRNKTTTSGQFEWTKYMHVPNLDHYLGENEYIRDRENRTNKGCVIFDQDQLIQKNCTEKYPGICVYSYDNYFPSFNNYCRRRYNDSCMSSDLGFATKCFCKNSAQSYKSPRNSFCTKLAELTSPYQNTLLTKHFKMNEPCWIGIEKLETNIGLFRWSSTNTSTNYTYFSNEINFENQYGALGYDGWTLRNDTALNCAICELEVKDHPKVKLYLKHNPIAEVIELEISNAIEVYQGVICFTENNTRFINLTENSQNFIVRRLWNSSIITENYWCKTWQLPGLTVVYSNTIFSSNPGMNSKTANLSRRRTCLPSVTNSGKITLHWPETEFGVTAIPEELCLQQDGSPVTRTCGGTLNYASNWLQVNGTCGDVTFSPRTLRLDELLHSTEATPTTLASDLLHITEDNNNVTSFQIHLVSKILEKVATSTDSVSDNEVKVIVTTVNNIMHYQPSRLRGAQTLLNSTDMVLCSLDDILVRTDLGEDDYTSAVSEKLLVQMSNVEKTGITGIKVYPSETSGFDSTKMQPLHQGISQDELLKENLDLAILTPQELYNDIINCGGSKTSPNLITTVFYDDTLFSEKDNATGQTDGRIISVLLPGFNCSFSAPLQVIFKTSANNNSEIKCASWVYGSNDVLENIHGHWSIEGNSKSVYGAKYQICEFRHVTHFALLVLGGHNTNISESHKKALDIITAVGSGLSLLGLLVVFLTAIIFKSYRSANGVVINFSLAMTTQIVLLFIADNVAGNRVLCTVFGAALHYIVLSQFCWMLTIAILQYQRYVLVFSNPTTHLVAKSCAFAWGLPLLPIIIIVSISTDNYGQNTYGLCYALGNYFIFGVLVPVAIIVFFNLLVFLRIMISIASSRKIKVHQRSDDTSTLQLRLAFLLYFLLGLTWGFGLLAAIEGGIVYSYLFCVTATLQGFVMFLFFIVLNERTRSLWINMKTCCCRSEYISGDSAATAMVRRAKNTASSDTCTDSTSSEMLRRYKNRSSSDF